jgi:hypothetical protein
MGPRRTVWPGESLEFSEEWNLFQGIKVTPGAPDLDELDRALTPVIQSLS